MIEYVQNTWLHLSRDFWEPYYLPHYFHMHIELLTVHVIDNVEHYCRYKWLPFELTFFSHVEIAVAPQNNGWYMNV